MCVCVSQCVRVCVSVLYFGLFQFLKVRGEKMVDNGFLWFRGGLSRSNFPLNRWMFFPGPLYTWYTHSHTHTLTHSHTDWQYLLLLNFHWDVPIFIGESALDWSCIVERSFKFTVNWRLTDRWHRRVDWMITGLESTEIDFQFELVKAYQTVNWGWPSWWNQSKLQFCSGRYQFR